MNENYKAASFLWEADARRSVLLKRAAISFSLFFFCHNAASKVEKVQLFRRAQSDVKRFCF